MESQILINSGITLVETLIAYLAKDAIGSDFLNNYLGGQSEQKKAAYAQKEALSRLIAASSEMNQSTDQITSRAEKNIERLNGIYDSISKLKESVERIEHEHRAYAEQFKNLISQTNDIRKLIDEISNVSEQTNLLSFNASIEAAHAGTAGAGFRIIANEVKNLSENTKKTTDRILENMKKLTKSIDELEMNTKSNSDSLHGLSKETEETLLGFDSVRKLNSANNSDVEQIGKTLSGNMRDMGMIVQNVQQAEDLNKQSLELFAESASKNQMLFNDLYSFVYEIKAIFEDLKLEQKNQ